MTKWHAELPQILRINSSHRWSYTVFQGTFSRSWLCDASLTTTVHVSETLSRISSHAFYVSSTGVTHLTYLIQEYLYIVRASRVLVWKHLWVVIDGIRNFVRCSQRFYRKVSWEIRGLQGGCCKDHPDPSPQNKNTKMKISSTQLAWRVLVGGEKTLPG